MSDKIHIAKMNSEDLKSVLALGQEHFSGPNNEWLIINYIKNSFQQPGLNYVAKQNDVIVGCIMMVFDDIVKNWIRFLIVKKETRRSGVGSLLLQKVTSHLKHGESVFVDTGVVDKSAIGFYEKNGFKNRGVIKSLYENAPGIIFEKNIK